MELLLKVHQEDTLMEMLLWVDFVKGLPSIGNIFWLNYFLVAHEDAYHFWKGISIKFDQLPKGRETIY